MLTCTRMFVVPVHRGRHPRLPGIGIQLAAGRARGVELCSGSAGELQSIFRKFVLLQDIFKCSPMQSV